MNIAVLEDDYKDKTKLENLLTLYKETTNKKLEIDFFSNGEIFLEVGIHKHYHLILMDIYMGKMDGIEIASYLQKIYSDAIIVYLTSSDDDIWRAVRTHGCFDYIRKSELTVHRIEKLFNDVTNTWQITENKLIFTVGKQDIEMNSRDIQYILSDDKYTIIVLKNNREVSYRITFSCLYELLKENNHFLFCNRGVLLNMDFIQEADGESFKMKDGSKFPLRRRGRCEIIKIFNDYQFEKLAAQRVIG